MTFPLGAGKCLEHAAVTKGKTVSGPPLGIQWCSGSDPAAGDPSFRPGFYLRIPWARLSVSTSCRPTATMARRMIPFILIGGPVSESIHADLAYREGWLSLIS